MSGEDYNRNSVDATISRIETNIKEIQDSRTTFNKYVYDTLEKQTKLLDSLVADKNQRDGKSTLLGAVAGAVSAAVIAFVAALIERGH